MADSNIALNEPGTVTKRLDTEQLVVATVTVQRERVQIAGALDVEKAVVANADPAAAAYGLIVRDVRGSASATPVFSDVTDRAARDLGLARQGAPAVQANRWPVGLSDGAAFYDAAKTGQLPAALVGGRLDVNIGAALPVGTNQIGYIGAARTASDTLAAVGNGTSISMEGLSGAAVEVSGVYTGLDARMQASVDGGTQFRDVDVYNVDTEVVSLTISVNGSYSGYIPAGASHVRMRVAAIATGSVTLAVRATYLPNARTHTAWDRVPGSSDPAHVIALGASDGTNLQRLRTATAAPAGTEQGLITRNIPSGTQPISGTVTANAGTGTLATDPIDRIARLLGVVRGEQADNAANPTTKIPVLPARANAAAPAWTEGNVVPLSVDLAGAARVVIPGTVDVSDRAARAVGAVSPAAASVWDVSDRAARNLGALAAQAADNSANSTSKLPILPARANAAAPTWTEGNQAPLSVDLAGSLRAAIIGTASVDVTDRAARAIGAVSPAAASVWDISDRAARLVGQVEGRAASGAAKAGNPNQIGGVFNTTQPTVLTGQAVEAQYTARGAQIVATGVEAFTADVSDRAARAVGAVSPAAASVWDVSDRAARNLGALAAQAADNSANSTSKLPVLNARANAAAPAWTEGNQVPLSVDLAGSLRTAVIGTPTVDITDRVARLIGTHRIYTADTTYTRGTATAPLAEGVVATITPGAGTYEVTTQAYYGGTADVIDNMQVQVGATVIGVLFVPPVVNGTPVPQRFPRLTVAAATAVTVNAVAAGAVGSVYIATITLTPVAA